MGNLVGYARINRADAGHDLARQVDALRGAGCVQVSSETASGRGSAPPELERLLDGLCQGDTLVVWSLDRLSRDGDHLLELGHDLAERGVGLRSLSEAIDTTTPHGKELFDAVVGVFAPIMGIPLEAPPTETHSSRRPGDGDGFRGSVPCCSSVGSPALSRPPRRLNTRWRPSRTRT